MADTPYMPLWPRDYLADTRHLTAEQHGAYLLLIMEAWLRPSCALPDDDALLSRLCCMSPAQWRSNKSVVLGFWTLDKKRKEWTQKRITKEHGKAVSKSKLARGSATTRWKTKGKDDANAMRSQCERIANQSHSQKDASASFSARDAPRKKPGFVKLRTAADAAKTLNERLELGYELGRNEASK